MVHQPVASPIDGRIRVFVSSVLSCSSTLIPVTLLSELTQALIAVILIVFVNWSDYKLVSWVNGVPSEEPAAELV